MLLHAHQDSLGGNSKVLSFVNISPAIYNLGETVCSLNFASRCRSTELGQAKKQTSTTTGAIANASSNSNNSSTNNNSSSSSSSAVGASTTSNHSGSGGIPKGT